MKCSLCQLLVHLLKMNLVRNNTSKSSERESNNIDKITQTVPTQQKRLTSSEDFETSQSPRVSDLAVPHQMLSISSLKALLKNMWLWMTKRMKMSITNKDLKMKKNQMNRRCR